MSETHPYSDSASSSNGKEEDEEDFKSATSEDEDLQVGLFHKKHVTFVKIDANWQFPN